MLEILKEWVLFFVQIWLFPVFLVRKLLTLPGRFDFDFLAYFRQMPATQLVSLIIYCALFVLSLLPWLTFTIQFDVPSNYSSTGDLSVYFTVLILLGLVLHLFRFDGWATVYLLLDVVLLFLYMLCLFFPVEFLIQILNPNDFSYTWTYSAFGLSVLAAFAYHLALPWIDPAADTSF